MKILLADNEIKVLLERLDDADDEDLMGIRKRLVEATKDEEQLAEDFKKYRETAHDTHHADGMCEIDDGAIVSHGSDPGAYVMAWVWVDAVDAGVMTEEERDKLNDDAPEPEPEKPSGYESRITCPVCDALFDIHHHPDENPSAQATAMLAGEHRRAHGQASPSCMQHKDWFEGWNITTKKLGGDNEAETALENAVESERQKDASFDDKTAYWNELNAQELPAEEIASKMKERFGEDDAPKPNNEEDRG